MLAFLYVKKIVQKHSVEKKEFTYLIIQIQISKYLTLNFDGAS